MMRRTVLFLAVVLAVVLCAAGGAALLYMSLPHSGAEFRDIPPAMDASQDNLTG